MIYDVIIIGLGPGGICSAIYAKRAGLNVLCLDKAMPGGYLNFIDDIQNYPGFKTISGPELAFKMYEQLKSLEIEFKNEEVSDIKGGEIKEVITKNDVYKSKKVIIATGRVSRELGLEHESELIGKGISHCAMCDGMLYKGKEVAVVGGGNSALSEALYLAKVVDKVHLIHRRNAFRAEEDLVKRVTDEKNIVTYMDSEVTELLVSDNKLAGIVLNNKDKLEIACMFTYVGYVPGTRFKTELDIFDEQGYIIVDNNCETKENGIYAIGDIIKKDVYQIVTAEAEGCIAVNHIVRNRK